MKFASKFDLTLKVLFFITISYLFYKGLKPEKFSQDYELSLSYNKSLVFNGIVVKKERLKSNHNNPLIVLNNGQKVVLFERFFKKIREKDSIVKFKDSLNITIYRDDTTHFELNLNDRK